MTSIRELKLLDLIPVNIAQDPQVRAAAEALDLELQAVTQAVDNCLLLARIEHLPESVLDLLAWQFHVDFYDPALPIEQKQALIKGTMEWHKKKGTPAAVEELISALFEEGKVVEWFEYGGEPYHFKVVTFNSAVTQEKAEEFIRALDSVKNARSHLEKVEITVSDNLMSLFAGVVHVGDYITVNQVG